jgi:hypothetical protein
LGIDLFNLFEERVLVILNLDVKFELMGVDLESQGERLHVALHCLVLNSLVIIRYILVKEAFESLYDLKIEQGASNLDALPFVLLPHLERHVLLSHQSPKFGVVVQYVKLIVLALYVRVFS